MGKTTIEFFRDTANPFMYLAATQEPWSNDRLELLRAHLKGKLAA